MRAKIVHRGQTFEFDDFDQLVVEDSSGRPVAVAGRYGGEHTYLVSSIDDNPRFNEVLQQLGINKTVIVTNLREAMLKPEFLPNIV